MCNQRIEEEKNKYEENQLKTIFHKINFNFIFNETVLKLLNILNGRIVGGIVRDSLLGIPTNDVDIATPYLPNEVMEILIKNNFNPIGTGIQYGTISVFLKNMKVEITSLRKDVKNFGRRAEVEFGGNWKEDSLRRDFTFNGLFLEINEKKEIYVYDYHSGIEDLKNGIVRFIGNYEHRIREDYLRILRFIRFFIRYSKNLDYINYVQNTMKNFSQLVLEMKLISMERVLMEIKLILKTPNWKLGLEMINYFAISDLFFSQKLIISSFSLGKNEVYEESEVRLIYALFSLEEKMIKNLPLEKKLRNNILFYKNFQNNPSVETIFNIWHRTKSLKETNFILNLWLANEKEKYKEYLNTHMKEEDFEKIQKNTILKHSFGPERGIEEKNIKINFIKNHIYKI